MGEDSPSRTLSGVEGRYPLYADRVHHDNRRDIVLGSPYSQDMVYTMEEKMIDIPNKPKFRGEPVCS